MIVPRFLDPLVLEEVDATRWRVAAECRYDSAVLGARLIVPVGYVTDLASVPRLPLAWLIAGDTARKAGLVHDFAYSYHFGATRATADLVFLEAMGVEGVPRWKALLMYLMVRWCGQPHW